MIKQINGLQVNDVDEDDLLPKLLGVIKLDDSNGMKKYLKKNPPINEEMIKALMMQMGRKPNQKQINQMMKAMEKFQ